MILIKKWRIRRSIKALSKAETCFPIDIFSLSREIAKIKDTSFLNSLIAIYGHNPNAFVRRCMLTAIKFSSEYFSSAPVDNGQYISSMLVDENARVQYDACWLIKDHGFMSPSDLDVIRQIAGDMVNLNIVELKNLKPTEASGYALAVC